MEELPSLPNRIAWFAPWTWKRRWKVAAVTLLLIVPIYAFSIGPAMLLTAHGWVKPESIAYAYRPLLRMRNNTPPRTRDTVKQYLVLWGGLSAREVIHVHGVWEDENRPRPFLRLR